MNITYGRLRQFVEEAGDLEVEDSIGNRKLLHKDDPDEVWDIALRANVFYWRNRRHTRAELQWVMDQHFASRTVAKDNPDIIEDARGKKAS